MQQLEESWWVQDWIAKGDKQGIEKGIEQGRRQGLAWALRTSPSERLGALPDWANSRIDSADEQALEPWFRRAGSAGSLDALLKG